MSREPGWIRPPHWDDAQLEADRHIATATFVHQRIEDGPAAYADEFVRLRPIVQHLFDSTDNLASLQNSDAGDSAAVNAIRHLAAPPISADDLKTVIEVLVFEGDGLTAQDALVEVALSALDPIRVPWLRDSRYPESPEVETAIAWTTGVWASERTRTARRMEPSQRQEEAVAAALTAAGFREVDRPNEIHVLDALDRGCFCREVMVAGTKTDMPARLHDGRLLAIECKVSNSYTNSVKRLIRETGGKSARWQNAFGHQVVTAAVLAGVFKLKNLREAQDQHNVTVFWEHDLEQLAAFVKAAV
ncbi:MAG: XamI family restriction endonuclease [Coriobacteriia bacterium]|nr:XamI family restriction endonuclease [Coriobacteriia bacterium]